MKALSFALLCLLLMNCAPKAKPPLSILDKDNLNIPVYNEDGLHNFLHQKDNNIHVVNFWATWCSPCVKEIPSFEKINQEFKDQNVELVLVSLDFEEQLETNLVSFVQKNIKSRVIVVLPDDQEKLITIVDSTWQGGLPATVIYSKNKRVFISGETDYQTLKQTILSLQ